MIANQTVKLMTETSSTLTSSWRNTGMNGSLSRSLRSVAVSWGSDGSDGSDSSDMVASSGRFPCRPRRTPNIIAPRTDNASRQRPTSRTAARPRSQWGPIRAPEALGC